MTDQLSSPDWQKGSKLIGYGIDSLGFHPPIFVPNNQTNPQLNLRIGRSPNAFVGLVTTQDHYQDVRSKTTKTLRELISRNPHLLRLTVLPELFSSGSDFLLLNEEQAQQLVEQYHAVRKRIEYEGTWKGKKLVYLIYPYGGLPLAKLCNQPQNAPGWSDLFTGLLEVTKYIRDLHQEDYVHGDLSPNNLLYDEDKPQTFTVIDWNMLCRAEDFLQHTKGTTRVGCWSPEHFSLTTVRLSEVEPAKHWHIYASEMQAYLQRMISFSGSSAIQQKLREFFGQYLSGFPVEYKNMYEHLRSLSRAVPSAVGKYHDLRYLADTIAKAIHSIYTDQTAHQKTAYNRFLAVMLSQNFPERVSDLENPDPLNEKLSILLHSCREAERNTNKVQSVKLNTTESTLFNLLQSESEK